MNTSPNLSFRIASTNRRSCMPDTHSPCVSRPGTCDRANARKLEAKYHRRNTDIPCFRPPTPLLTIVQQSHSRRAFALIVTLLRRSHSRYPRFFGSYAVLRAFCNFPLASFARFSNLKPHFSLKFIKKTLFHIIEVLSDIVRHL
jgi:hypothetical protein